jgi:hypothetical protein
MGACHVLIGVLLAAGAETPLTRLLQGLGAFLQGVEELRAHVAAGELNAIHNEDETLGAAVSLLRTESRLATPALQQRLSESLTLFGQQLADVHQAADVPNVPETTRRLQTLLDTAARIRSVYRQDVLGSAQRLAGRYTCPMHRDVIGPRGANCAKCGMPLDQPLRIQLSPRTAPPIHTVDAVIRSRARPEVGKPLDAMLHLAYMGSGSPVPPADLRVVHTERIHLLAIDASLTDYHHIHPQPTRALGDYTFTFIPAKPGPYRFWADLRTAGTGFQEYAVTDLTAQTKPAPLEDRRTVLTAKAEGLVYTLRFEKRAITLDAPVRARLRVTYPNGRPFTQLEPIMGTFAHLVAFNEDRKTVVHIHPTGAIALTPTDRAGPELEFLFYPTAPGFHRLFAQVQIKGTSRFAPFGVTVTASAARTRERTASRARTFLDGVPIDRHRSPSIRWPLVTTRCALVLLNGPCTR